MRARGERRIGCAIYLTNECLGVKYSPFLNLENMSSDNPTKTPETHVESSCRKLKKLFRYFVITLFTATAVAEIVDIRVASAQIRPDEPNSEWAESENVALVKSLLGEPEYRPTEQDAKYIKRLLTPEQFKVFRFDIIKEFLAGRKPTVGHAELSQVCF